MRRITWAIAGIFIVIIVIGGIIWVFNFLSDFNEKNDNEPVNDDIIYLPAISTPNELMLKVGSYSKIAWDQIVGNNSDPAQLFGGKADEINATCKSYFKRKENSTVDIFEIIELFTGITISESLKLPLRETYNLYGEWRVWNYIYDYWHFTTDEFLSNYPDERNKVIPVFQDPEDFSKIIDEWQTLSADPYFPNITSKQFIYNLVIKGVPMMKPVNNYLETVVNTIGSNEVDFFYGNSISRLKITYNEVEKYTILADYSNYDGQITFLEFSGENHAIFYCYDIYTEFQGAIFGYDIYLLLCIFSISLMGIIYTLRRKGIMNSNHKDQN